MKTFANVLMILIGIVLTASMSLAGEGRIEIRLYPQCELIGSSVRLSDVAQIRAGSAEAEEKLGGIEVAKVSADVHRGSIGKSDIYQGLTQAGYEPLQIDVYGATSCSFSLKGNEPAASVSPGQEATDLAGNGSAGSETIPPLTAEELNHAAGDTLRNHLTGLVSQATGLPMESLSVEWRCRRSEMLDEPWTEGRWEIRPVRAITLGAVQFEIHENSGAGSDEKDAKRRNEDIPVSGTAYYVYRCLAAVHAIRPGEVIGKEDVKWVVRNAETMNETGIQSMSEAVGQEVLTTIRAEQILMPRMIRKLQLVKRNDRVEVFSRVGSVVVSLQGIAKNSGGLGDEILIAQENSKQILRGRITGSGKATVDTEESLVSVQETRRESLVN